MSDDTRAKLSGIQMSVSLYVEDIGGDVPSNTVEIPLLIPASVLTKDLYLSPYSSGHIEISATEHTIAHIYISVCLPTSSILHTFMCCNRE